MYSSSVENGCKKKQAERSYLGHSVGDLIGVTEEAEPGGQ